MGLFVFYAINGNKKGFAFTLKTKPCILSECSIAI